MASNFARFPLPFRVGTDICHATRFRALLRGERKAGKLIRRIFTEDEQQNASAILDPLLSEQRVRTISLKDKNEKIESAPLSEAEWFVASRFAAKEAVIKASDERVTFHDIEIRKEDSGRPFALVKSVVDGRTRWKQALLSISHDGEYTTATAIVASEFAWPKEERQ